MSTKNEFLTLALELSRNSNRERMLPVIQKELLHYEILLALDEARILELLSFQGGTCLRLCYSSERYSEDLDFAGGTTLDHINFTLFSETIRQALLRRYAVDVSVEEPVASTSTHVTSCDSITDHISQIPTINDSEGAVRVRTWTVLVTVAANRPDLPKQRINIQVACVPAHTRMIRSMIVNYAELPASYADTLIVCESLEEIAADKLLAFVSSKHIRHRDLWDLRWLAVQAGFDHSLLPRLFDAKLDDYAEHGRFNENQSRVFEIPEILQGSDFNKQMLRFLPTQVIDRTLKRSGFYEHMAETVMKLYQIVGAL
ncbi:MAG: nucleotidyl transferase AbiEii/AbiGii toxin family protein [Coriobacteriales bacterium]|jgi:predicted nucleotidyltransferase component of viral defense system|nr:nucleotidyl transferase AbiEii/AbiGii toxin family protein [Coriobacteriales bacterium]